MCGICGVVGEVDESRLWAMANSMAHRGPDGAGVRCFGGSGDGIRAGLGHRRLSIIDPTPRGAQPMSYADERYWITYNGEIYNFRELRAGLEREGFPFQSDCDTEVLLALYARDGAAMLRQLNGIFAFGIWDTERRELFLARDRMGVKPLYYHQHDGGFSFASEVKALIAGGLRPRMSHTAIADFLTFLWVPDPATMFEGVYKLPPGHYGIFTDRRLAITQYWDLEFPVDDGPGDAEWATQVRGAVSGAVRRQRISDVPLGSFLSGGIDSSAIVAELSSIAAPVTTFTVGFSAEDLRHEIVPDDVKYARKVAEQFKTDYHERVLDAEIVDLLPKLVWHMDEPVADPAAITTYLICSQAREKLTVILSGMGGDEIFAGYPRYLAARIAHTFDLLPTPLRARMRAVTEARLTLGRPGRMRGPRRNLLKLVRGLDQTFHDRYLTYSSYYKVDELGRLLGEDLRQEITGHDPFARHRAHLAKVEDEHWLNQLLYLDAKTFLPCLNLTYTDKMSMAASTEVRVPLLDDELVELAARIPPRLKLHNTQRKYVLKQSMRGVLSEDVIWRPKAGFGAPVRSWLTNELRPLVDEMLSVEATAARGLLEPAEVRRIVNADRAGTEDNALRVWALLNLELWQRTFVDGVASIDAGQRLSRPTVVDGEATKSHTAQPETRREVRRKPPAHIRRARRSNIGRRNGSATQLDVLLVGPYPPPFGGVSAHVKHLGEMIQHEGLSVGILNHFHTESSNPLIVGDLRRNPLLCWRALRKANARVVHYHHSRWSTLIAVAAAMPTDDQTATAITVHGQVLDRYLRGRQPVAQLTKRALQRFDSIIAVSPEIAAVLQAALPGRPIEVIPAYLPNGADDASGRLSAESHAFLNAGAPTLIAVAYRLYPDGSGIGMYGLDFALDGFASLAGEHSTLQLAIFVAQDPRSRRERRQLAQLRGQVAAAGAADRVRIIIGEALVPAFSYDCILLRPTSTDGDAVAIREALAAGKQVLASDVVARPAGVTALPLERECWTEAISRAIQGPDPGPPVVHPAAKTGALPEVYRSLRAASGRSGQK
jgi:asparagine synthase (glutamine-hydrolysing)